MKYIEMMNYLPDGGAYSPQREQIREMRQQGSSCMEIALRLHLPKERVAAFLNELGFPAEGEVYPAADAGASGASRCLFCGMALKQPWTGRRKKFCTRLCRERWRTRQRKNAVLRMEDRGRHVTGDDTHNAKPQEMQPVKLRVAAYIRVSTAQESQQESFAVQERYFRELLLQNPDWEAAGIYADYGISGTYLKKRSGLLRLLRHCSEGRIDRIITKSISRFARNTGDFLRMLKMLRAQGVTVLFEKENLDTAKPGNEFVITALCAAAQEESRNISENIRWGYQKRFQAGEAKNMPVYGYRFSSEEADDRRYRRVEIVGEQAAVVQQIFADFSAEESYIKIARKLNAKQAATGGGWTAAQVAAVIRQERYSGDVLLQKTYVTDFLTHKAVRNHGERQQYLAADHHPAIIGKEQFEQAQYLAAQKTQGKPAGKKEPKKRYDFSGLLVCSACGRFYTVRNRKHRPIWYCPTGFPDNGSGQCAGRRLYEEQIAALICTAVYERVCRTNAEFCGQLCVDDVFAGRYIAQNPDVCSQREAYFLRNLRMQMESMQEDDANPLPEEDPAENRQPAFAETADCGSSGPKSTEAAFLLREEALAWMRTLPGGRIGMQAFLRGVTTRYARAFFDSVVIDYGKRLTLCWFDGARTSADMEGGVKENVRVP